MQKKIGLFICIVVFFSCEKGNAKSLDSGQGYYHKAEKGGPYVKAGGTWNIARKTEYRPRDGKNCGCVECIGLCNFKGKAGIVTSADNEGDGVIVTDSSTSNSATFYILFQHPESEIEFVVDDTVDIPVESIEGHPNLERFAVLPGDYEYEGIGGTIEFEGQSRDYYGTVDIHVLVEEL
jgi:hypothetical protein